MELRGPVPQYHIFAEPGNDTEDEVTKSTWRQSGGRKD